MSKSIVIPSIGSNPMIIKLNGVVYSYPAGTTQTVPDDVASLIDNIVANFPKGIREPNVYNIRPVEKTSAMTSPVGMDTDGKLYTEDKDTKYTLPVATDTRLGGVKKAANVPASAAEDVAGCVTTINAILTALKTAGIMVADT